MSETKLFEIFVNSLKFDITEFLELGALNDYQQKIIEQAGSILKDNTVGEIKMFGGSLKKHESKLKELTKKAEEEIKQDKYKSIKKDLEKFLKDYVKKLRDLIDKTCLAIIPVKEMPWVDIIFRTVPRLTIQNKKAEFSEHTIAYYGEVKCVIPRTTLYGKMKDAKPLFAPYMGELDLGGFKLDEAQQKAPKAQVYPYISAIIESLDSATARSQLAKYHEGYQRHGEPICDFLMKDDELMGKMDKVTSSIESKRVNSDIAVCGIALPFPADNTTLVVIMDESKDSDRFVKCFEACLLLSAACCEAPATKKDFEETAAQAAQMTQAAQAQAGPSGPGPGGLVGQPQQSAQAGGQVRTPGGQELKVWTAEELQEEAQKRGTGGGVPPGMETWDEEALQEMAKTRGSGIPEGMEVWDEESLQELAKKRQGGLDIPEWKVDDALPECSKCGYSLRPGWTECPVCETPVSSNAQAPAASAEKPSAGPEKTPEQPTEKEPSEPKKEDETAPSEDKG